MYSKPFRTDQPSDPLLVQPLSKQTVEEVIQLLDDWMADESGYDEAAWDELKVALDQARSSIDARGLFVE
ncbi:hypothetical protein [Egbenema bharatensis]|uniref:hypothetical protein n=1 Tax=Egbenema bharatensis TaxID=3463334 RepID=UPI003A8B37F2